MPSDQTTSGSLFCAPRLRNMQPSLNISKGLLNFVKCACRTKSQVRGVHHVETVVQPNSVPDGPRRYLSSSMHVLRWDLWTQLHIGHWDPHSMFPKNSVFTISMEVLTARNILTLLWGSLPRLTLTVIRLVYPEHGDPLGGHGTVTCMSTLRCNADFTRRDPRDVGRVVAC